MARAKDARAFQTLMGQEVAAADHLARVVEDMDAASLKVLVEDMGAETKDPDFDCTGPKCWTPGPALGDW